MRIQWIDSLKGFLISLVVLGHVMQSAIDSNAFIQWNNVLIPVFNWIYSFHMPLFFFISGYLYKSTWQNRIYAFNFKKLLFNKEINLIILYLVFSFTLGILKMLIKANFKEAVSIYDLFLIPVNPISVYWFLHVLIIYFLIFPCIDRLHLNYISYPSMGSLFMISCLSSLVGLPSDLNKILFHLFFFAFGIFLYQRGDSLNLKYWASAILICVLILITLNENEIVRTLIAAFWCVFFYALFKVKEKLVSNRIIIILGEECLSIYLFHPFFVAIYKFLMLKRIENAALYCVLGTSITLSLIIVACRFLKKIGIYDYMFNPGKVMAKTMTK